MAAIIGFNVLLGEQWAPAGLGEEDTRRLPGSAKQTTTQYQPKGLPRCVPTSNIDVSTCMSLRLTFPTYSYAKYRQESAHLHQGSGRRPAQTEVPSKLWGQDTEGNTGSREAW